MDEKNLILLVVGIIGFIQVTFAAVLAYLNNRSAANKDDESVYAGLVDRLEKRLAASDKRIWALERKCEKYELLLEKHEEKTDEFGE
jgi:hypothetical protein